ncbi:MAG: DoxX family protein [Deltaproteobacteria bacterium]|nr:MAG: DoxX family protein [Deltaproteobacteria bacterium]TMB27153.1 MAG: DoxX family protein [Deltaproteobacteria bacterium]TMB34886.1 MAG: DoxX family protein [Deltaproteobacteria bacterium]
MDRVPRWILVILRVHLGVILLVTVSGKIARNDFTAEMLQFLRRPGMAAAPAFYRDYIASVVIPHARLFAGLVIAGELTGGISLLFGLGTRIGAAIAMVLFVNYMLAKGRWFWSPDSQDAAVFFEALAVFLGSAGRTFGLDALLFARRAR